MENEMSAHERTDAELLAEFVATGRGAPFEALVRRHGALVFGTCLRILNETHDAEDAAQAVFLTLARKAKSLQGHESVAGWLYRVAWHVSERAARSAFRIRKREREMKRMGAASEEGESAWAAIKPVLDKELGALPEKYRLPLIVHYLEGRTEEEAARQLGCKTSTLSMRLIRARELLRGRLARSGVALSGGMLATLMAENAASAALSTATVSSTVKAGVLIAAGKAAAVSAPVNALVEVGVKAMLQAKLKVAATLMIAAGMVGTGGAVLAYKALPPDQETVAAPLRGGGKLSSFEEIHALIKPRAERIPSGAGYLMGESKYLDEIPWMTDVWEARRKAAAEGKPLFIFSATCGPLGYT